MKPIRPRRLGHAGQVAAQGLLLDPALLGTATCRRRVLELWRPGAQLHDLQGQLLLRWPDPASMRAETAPGQPLVAAFGGLVSGRIDADEAARLAPDPPREGEPPDLGGAIIWVSAGEARRIPLDELHPVDPARWIDLSAYEVAEVEPLGPPPPPPAPPPDPPSAKLADLLPDLPPPDPGRALVQASLRGEQVQDGAWAKEPGLWARLGAGLRGLFAARAPRPRAEAERAPRARPQPARGAAPPVAAPPTWLQRLLRWWLRPPAKEGRDAAPDLPPVDAPPPTPPRDWLRPLRALWARFVFGSQLGRMIGRRQAQYFQALLDALEDGDVDEALRRAIPLSNAPGSGPSMPALGLPTPNTSLRPRLGPKASSGRAFAVGDSLFDTLKAHYRRVYDRLVQQGRIDEAAFVLADLLDETDEAVAFLEKHGRLRLAAELAEARALSPARVVRQWLLADEGPRAIQLAKRHDVFAAAVALLEPGQAEAARRLRLLWADALAERGDFLGAVRAIHQFEDTGPLTDRFIEAGIQLGGPSAAQLLGFAVTHHPEAYDRWLDHAARIWADDGAGASEAKAALARALLEQPWSAAVGRLCVGTVRALYDELGRGRLQDPTQLQRLVQKSQDPVLRADWPGLPPAPTDFAQRSDVEQVSVPSGDVGALPIFDACPLGKGRALVALGEAGVRLLSREGKTVRHFDVPAERLVISDEGHRALALMPRGATTWVSRIDLVFSRAGPWCELRLDAFAETFDGWTWVVAQGGALSGLDAGASRAAELWRNRDCRPIRILRTPQRMTVVHVEGVDIEVWRFGLPQATLRARTPASLPDTLQEVHIGTPDPDGHVPYIGRQVRRGLDADGEEVTVESRAVVGETGYTVRSHALPHPPLAETRQIARVGPWIQLVSAEAEAGVVRMVRAEDGLEQVRLRLVGAERPGARVHGTTLLAFDELGRLLRFDLASGRLVGSLRLHP